MLVDGADAGDPLVVKLGHRLDAAGSTGRRKHRRGGPLRRHAAAVRQMLRAGLQLLHSRERPFKPGLEIREQALAILVARRRGLVAYLSSSFLKWAIADFLRRG